MLALLLSLLAEPCGSACAPPRAAPCHLRATMAAPRAGLAMQASLEDILFSAAEAARTLRTEELLALLHQAAAKEHAQECASGARNFVPSSSHRTPHSPRRRFTNADFDTRSVGSEPRLAGLDTRWLGGVPRALQIHRTRQPLLNEDEISALKAEAAAAIARGQGSNFTFTKENNLGEVHTAELPAARSWLSGRLEDSFFPLLAERYGLDAAQLRVFDSLVIKYDEQRDAVLQPVHRDSSLLSINVALSDRREYDGGGTYFEGLAESLPLERGCVMCHPSAMRHAGHRITRGERWVLQP